MKWTELITTNLMQTYAATEGLMALVDEDKLDWKPDTGSNWMTTGQLLKHITEACGKCISGFVTGDWGIPEGVDKSQMLSEDMLPPAEKMPAVATVSEAETLLAQDKQLALRMVTKAGEDNLEHTLCSAPWDPSKVVLGQRLLSMVGHLAQHKDQLFYYLKLQGKPVNTSNLYGGM